MGTEIVLVPQVHGGAIRRGGPGRKPSRVELARREAGKDLLGFVRKLREIRDAEDASADDVCKAAVACLRISGAEREKPPAAHRSTFSVVARSAQELAQIDTPDPEPQPDSGPGAPRKQKGEAGTRVHPSSGSHP